jgi:hypothetical protein
VLTASIIRATKEVVNTSVKSINIRLYRSRENLKHHSFLDSGAPLLEMKRCEGRAQPIKITLMLFVLSNIVTKNP